MNLTEIKKIIKDFEKSEINELEIRVDKNYVKVSKQKEEKVVYHESVAPQQVSNVKVDAEEQGQPKSVEGTEVKAPLVGTFYAQPGPDKPAYVKVGDQVNKGQVLCIVEAMKVMNEIVAPVDGTIVDICVMDEAVVEYDQTLFVIK